MSENTSFAFVVNLLDVTCTLPYEIIEGCYFQKANSTQIKQIKDYLIRSGHFPELSEHNLFIYELNYVKDQNEQEGEKFSEKRINEQDWKYYVVTFKKDDYEKINDLALVANLAEVELDLGLRFNYYENLFSDSSGGFGTTCIPINLFNSFFRVKYSLFPELINDKKLQEIALIYKSFLHLDKDKFSNIDPALKMLDDLKHLPYYSKFSVLGLFAIIELLITHKPSDTGDSLRRQVAAKIPLLSKRFSKQLDYTNFFGTISEETIWKKLYDYRSNIAHGTPPDFKNELKVLKDDSNAKKFLKLAVKMLLQHSLIEPQLYNDLKEC